MIHNIYYFVHISTNSVIDYYFTIKADSSMRKQSSDSQNDDINMMLLSDTTLSDTCSALHILYNNNNAEVNT